MINGITIRDYKPSDYTDVINLWSQTGLGGVQRGDNQQIIEQSIAMGGKLLVAINSVGELVGTSWMTFDGRRIHLHHFGVSPKHQRQGIGKILTKKSIDFAKEKGCIINQYEICGNYLIGLDEVRNFVFFETKDMQFIDL